MTNIEPTPRDPEGTDPHSHTFWRNNWPVIGAVVLAAFVVIALFASMSTQDTRTVTNTPPPATETK